MARLIQRGGELIELRADRRDARRTDKAARNVRVGAREAVRRIKGGRCLFGGADQELIVGIILLEKRGLRGLKAGIEHLIGKIAETGGWSLRVARRVAHTAGQAANEGNAEQGGRHAPPDRAGIDEKLRHDQSARRSDKGLGEIRRRHIPIDRVPYVLSYSG